jgi:glycosyltransferase involved in cell wall biosynthesis
MQTPQEVEHHEPGRGEAVSFFLKSRVLIARRWWGEFGQAPASHAAGNQLGGAPVSGAANAPLWTQISAAEFPLTAGKVQNLRAACRRFDGIEVPAGEVFSFWKQLGRTTRAKGFTEGRELRSGCLVPNLGGGLCQLSGLLYSAAVAAGLEVVERHEHSRALPGSPLPADRDATVFWNYVDLRFRAPFAWRLETHLTADALVVSIRSAADPVLRKSLPEAAPQGAPVRAAADGDCLTCGVTSCFRHPSANRNHTPAQGHGAWLLDGCWPEFDAWCQLHSHPGDHWLTPLDGHRWNRPGYAWNPPTGVQIRHATFETLKRSWHQRRLPGQGAIRQNFLLDAQRRLAENFAHHLDPQARHLVVSQTLLPHLWKAGHLGGRTFDVLVNRWPLAELQARLDAAATHHPESDTLVDFRADPGLVLAETQAFAAAARIVTPHRAIAASFGSRAILLDWKMPAETKRAARSTDPVRWFFPASALARKGIHELAAALREIGGELLLLGQAREGGADPLRDISHRHASVAELANCTALVIPAWIEHEPRLALRALSLGIPVIASRTCGLSPHPLLTEIEAGDVDSLRDRMEHWLASGKKPTVSHA